MSREEIRRLSKKLAAVLVLAGAMVVMSPVEARADWECFIQFGDDMETCMFNCDWSEAQCIWFCTSWVDGEHRAECMDDCIDGLAACYDWCGQHCNIHP